MLERHERIKNSERRDKVSDGDSYHDNYRESYREWETKRKLMVIMKIIRMNFAKGFSGEDMREERDFVT